MPRRRKSSDEDKPRKNTIESFFKKSVPKKSRAIIDSDEDDEKPKQKSIDNYFKTPSPKKKSRSEPNNNSHSEKLTPVSAVDFFGSSSVSRKNKTVPAKRKIEEINTELHDDDDFEKTLLQLDVQSKKKVIGNSLASKVSSKMKHIIEDTPEPKEKKPRLQVVVPDTPELKKTHSKKTPDKKLYKMELVKSPSKTPLSQNLSPKKTPEVQSTPDTIKKDSSKKISPSSNSSTSPQDETQVKRGASYRSYLHREGPKALGSKEIPEGADNCLDGLVFVITGVLESLERDEAKSLIEKYSGKVSGSLSKKTDYIVIGRDCGESKLQKVISTMDVLYQSLYNIHVYINSFTIFRPTSPLKEESKMYTTSSSDLSLCPNAKSSSHGRKHCLVMDEVDGMAGNEDRGGLQALVQLIKTTKIPIICMCNDRNHQKMRTLSNYCFDLRFQKPRLEQIKAAMMTMAFKEGLKIPAPALNEIIQSSNHDIRQVIHNISMWTSGDKTISYEQAKKDSQSAKKDLKIGPFDVCRKVFVGGEETAGMTLNDKSDLFFHDYSFAPLFVHENYPHVFPYSASGNPKRHLSLLARTADSICDGDLADRRIRSEQMWSLLPTQAIYASVLPGEFMRGSFPQMVNFPSWLGKNSSQNKTERILQELRTHMRLKVSAEKRSLNMDYLPYLRHGLTEPLVKRDTQGVPDVIRLMDEYDIIKEDFDNILEVTKWPNSKDPMSSLTPSTKAAFTRSYNKEVHLTPYSTGVAVKKRRGAAAVVDEEMMGDGEEAVQDSEEDTDNIDIDTMIKVKKKPTSKAKTTGRSKASKDESASGSKGKGNGKGKGRGKVKS
ncbi:hypothetical protein ScPMuIL_008738 [Solemya velum]